jgi:hypothetical protein
MHPVAVGVLVAGLIAWKMVPVKIAASQLYDYMEDEAKFAAGTQPDAQKRIFQKARGFELPVKEENIWVEKRATTSDALRLHRAGRVPGYTYVWNFDHQVNRPIYIF